MSSMLSGKGLHHGMLYMTLAAAVVAKGVQATEHETQQLPMLRESSVPYRPPPSDRLTFKAPETQLFRSWRCADSYAYSPRRSDTLLCQESGFAGDFLPDPLDPYVTLRLILPPRPLLFFRPPRQTVPGAPPSQLPNC